MERKSELKLESFNVSNFNWLGDGTISKNIIKKVFIKVRARAYTSEGQVDIHDNKNASVKLYQPVEGVAKGQGCVVYEKNGQLLGGDGYNKYLLFNKISY